LAAGLANGSAYDSNSFAQVIYSDVLLQDRRGAWIRLKGHDPTSGVGPVSELKNVNSDIGAHVKTQRTGLHSLAQKGRDRRIVVLSQPMALARVNAIGGAVNFPGNSLSVSRPIEQGFISRSKPADQPRFAPQQLRREARRSLEAIHEL